jgi:excinuclease ABC subunit A
MTLNRKSNSLSGGESQRINLATSLGSSLVGVCILIRPSIGSTRYKRLIKVLKKLARPWKYSSIVEHDEEMCNLQIASVI